MALRLLGTKLSKRILPWQDLSMGLRPLHAMPKAAVILTVEDSFASAARAKRMSLVHGKRNFALRPSTTENVPKMNSFKKSPSAPRNYKCPKLEAVERCVCDYCSSQRGIEKFLERLYVYGPWMFCMGTIWNVYGFVLG